MKAYFMSGVLALGLLAAHSMNAQAAEERHGDHHWEQDAHYIRGVTVTGVNSVLGKPFFSWGEPFGSAFSFTTLGIFNPDGPKPLPLDEHTPRSALLATNIDPVFLAISGKPPEYELNPEWINVPLRDVPVLVDFAFENKEPLPSDREVGPLEYSQTEPANPITLGQWMRASGVAAITCTNNGARVKLSMRNLIPNRLYTVWANMGLPSQGPAPAVFPIPIGGTPNFFITDENGDATFKRRIKFCPYNQPATESPLLFIDVHFNARHQTYGAVVAPGFVDGNWPGIVTFSHLVFPVNVERVNN